MAKGVCLGVLCALAGQLALAPAVLDAAQRDLRIVAAAERRDLASVRALVRQRVNVNAPQGDGATALHWAAHWDEPAIARALISAGASVDPANDYGVTPLLLAAGNGSARMAAMLLQAGARPDLALPSGETPLMAAARVGGVDAAAALLDKGASVNHQEKSKGQSALMWALAEGHLEMAQLLMTRGADIHQRSQSGMTPLLFAVRHGSVDAVRALLGRGARIEEATADGVTPLLMATVRGHVNLIDLLLAQGADVNAGGAGFTALHWAAGTWETSMTHDYPEAEGEWRVLGGLQERKIDVIKALIARGADVDARVRKNPPRFGINMFQIIKMTGATPFWIAAMSADVDVMRVLADHGANPALATDDDVTPLMVASGMGRVEGDSLISDAQSVAAVRLCLELGNKVNAVNKSGETALHGASWFGLSDVARLLVERGADMTIKDNQGQNPIESADGTTKLLLYRTHPATAKVLRELQAARTR